MRGWETEGQRKGEKRGKKVCVWRGEKGERERTRLTGQVVCGNGQQGHLCGWEHRSAAFVSFQTVGTDGNNKLISSTQNI